MYEVEKGGEEAEEENGQTTKIKEEVTLIVLTQI